MTTLASSAARPRVLQCITRIGLGGAEAVAASIVRALAGEFEFAVYAVRGIESSDVGRALHRELEELRVPIFSGPNVSQKYGGMLLAGIWAGRACRSFQPAIIHLHTEIPESAYATRVALAPIAAPGTIVRTIHNSVYWHFWPRLGRWCERRLARSHVAGVSADALAAFQAHRARAGAAALPSEPVVIYNGVGAAAARLCIPNSGRPVRVLFAGRFEPQKGTDLLPQILARVRPPPSGCELVLHGHGSHAPALAALAASPPPGWRIEVLPPVADLAARMRAFDLLLMPSRYEGLGLVAIEATLAGVCIVATDAPGLREALPMDHPWCGRVGDAESFARALQDALEQRDRWADTVRRAQAFARERFNPERMRDGYRTLYHRALA